MTTVEYKYKYGHGYQTFSLEKEHVLDEIKIAEFPPLTDLKAAVLDAIYHPIASEPIDKLVKPGMKVAFICNDSTRVANTHDFMPILVDEMNKLGVKDEDMKIVFALGTHRAMSHEEMVEQVSEGVAARLKMYNSDCNKHEDFNYFGATSYGTPVLINKLICDVDLVIMTGTVVYHFFSGFGGGRKAVLPGVAGMETVRRNHSLMMSPNSQLGKLQGNPVYEDQMEGVALFAQKHRLFNFNAILDAQKRFLKIFAGDWKESHLEACQFVEQVRKPDMGDLFLAEADAIIAAQNAVVAAHSLGVGSCYIGDITENYEYHRELLKLPKYVVPAAMLCFGYPTQQQLERAKPPRHPIEALVHENGYDREKAAQMPQMLAAQQGKSGEALADYIRRFCQRKWNSAFSQEMSRSCAEMARQWCEEAP